MKLSAPKIWVWWLSVILGILGILGEMGVVPALSPYAFALVVIGLVLLVIANMVKGL